MLIKVDSPARRNASRFGSATGPQRFSRPIAPIRQATSSNVQCVGGRNGRTLAATIEQASESANQTAGIEPASCSNSSESPCCLCENCQDPCAARALQPGGPNCHFLSSLDADLQRVIAAWDGLPAAIRQATLALIGSQ
jgi:hypothetical protein